LLRGLPGLVLLHRLGLAVGVVGQDGGEGEQAGAGGHGGQGGRSEAQRQRGHRQAQTLQLGQVLHLQLLLETHSGEGVLPRVTQMQNIYIYIYI